MNDQTRRERTKTRNLTKQAIKSGILVRPDKCELCSVVSKLDAHHLDYNDHLKVQWLCKPCHRTLHKKVISIEEKFRCGTCGKTKLRGKMVTCLDGYFEGLTVKVCKDWICVDNARKGNFCIEV